MSLPTSCYDTCPIIRFGKHSGSRIDRLPLSYQRWMAKSISDPFLRETARAILRNDRCLPKPEQCIFLDISRSGNYIEIDAPYHLYDDVQELSDVIWKASTKRWLTPIKCFDEVFNRFPDAHLSVKLKERVGTAASQQQALMDPITPGGRL